MLLSVLPEEFTVCRLPEGARFPEGKWCFTGVTQEEALKKYRGLLSAEGQLSLTQARSVTVQAVRDAVMDGESYVYLIADGVAYRLRLSDDERAILIQAGDTVELLCADGDEPVLQAQLAD